MRHKRRRTKQIEPDDPSIDLTLLVSTDAPDGEGDIVEQDWVFPHQIPFLFAHKGKQLPVGHIKNPRVIAVDQLDADVRERISDEATRATVIDVDIDEGDEFAEAVLRKYQRGDLEDTSVGFDPIDFEELDDGRFRFIESELKEVSALPIGANSDTTVLRKTFDPQVIPEQLKQADQFPPPPETMREDLRLGLEWHEQGYSGDGLQESTVRWASRMADGETPSEEKALKMGGWFSRHLSQDGPLRDEDDDPTPRAVSIKLWGGAETGPAYTRRLYRVMEREIPDTLAELDGDTDETKEGRRNRAIDLKVQHHMKELAEFLMGERKVEDVGPCPMATTGSDSEMCLHGLTEKVVHPFQDLPLADRETTWDSSTAVAQLRALAGLDEGQPTTEAETLEPLMVGHAWHADEPETMDDFALPYARVSSGELQAVPGGIIAASGAVQGARGGVEAVPDEELDDVEKLLGRYYAKMREELDDFDRPAPWDQEESGDIGQMQDDKEGKALDDPLVIDGDTVEQVDFQKSGGDTGDEDDVIDLDDISL